MCVTCVRARACLLKGPSAALLSLIDCYFTAKAEAQAVTALNNIDAPAAAQAIASAGSSGGSQAAAQAIAQAYSSGVNSIFLTEQF